MNVNIQLKSNPISHAVKLILKVNHTITDQADAELVITDDPSTLLSALKADKEVVQFIPWLNEAGSAATGLLDSDFADRVHIFAPSEDQRDNLTWLDDFVAFLTSLTTPAESGKE